MSPRFVILGSGRSGSGYIAQVLTRAGIACGHEEWWNPTGFRNPAILGDSSWCALDDDLSAYPDLVVFHQIRHPLDVISSFARRWSRDDVWWPMKARTMDGAPDDDIDAAIKCWVVCNRKAAERAEKTWKLEQVNAPLIFGLVDRLGLGDRVPVTSILDALDRVPRTYNQHSRGRRFTWDDLEGRPGYGDLLALAHEYGYGPCRYCYDTGYDGVCRGPCCGCGMSHSLDTVAERNAVRAKRGLPLIEDPPRVSPTTKDGTP